MRNLSARRLRDKQLLRRTSKICWIFGWSMEIYRIPNRKIKQRIQNGLHFWKLI